MVEVFKTNVSDPDQARRLTDQIHLAFAEYRANFDLEDCDNILRIKASSGSVCTVSMIDLLKGQGYEAEVLI
jgi:hypothetical protein